MTVDELSKYDGRDGQAAYVAISGSIYDVSKSARWQAGNHEGAHQAGVDLTDALKTAPHVRTVIERFPIIGKLETKPAVKPGKGLPMPLIIGAALIFLAIAALLFR